MTEVRTRDEALVAVGRGLSQWLTTTVGVFQQAMASAEGARSIARNEVRKWATKAAALEVRLGALKEREDPHPLEQALRNARKSHQEAQQAAAKIDDIARRLSSLQRSYTQRSTALVNEARANLSRRIGELDSYRAGGPGSAAAGLTGGAAGSGGSGSSALARFGLDQVEVCSASFANNPILDNFSKGGTTRADYRWAVQTWDEVVSAGVARGLTRHDFERRDAERGAAPLRRTAAVYDMFLGDSDRIRVSRMPDGTVDVTNGRHRFQIARELGIRNLPGEIFG